jgi:hypothetical protein
LYWTFLGRTGILLFMNDIIWLDRMSVPSGTFRRDWLDEKDTNATIVALETAAGYRGDEDEDGWYGVCGRFNGHVFTLYTHKSVVIKIGGFANLDVAGLKVALAPYVR